MADTWTHPELGSFQFDFDCWAGSAPIPGLAIFPVDDDEDDDEMEYPKGQTPISFWVDQYADLEEGEEDPPPSSKQIKAAQAFIRDADQIAPLILDALWADIEGTGPDSGMWWHGSLDEVNENGMFEEIGEQPVTDRESLRQSLVLSQIIIGREDDPSAVEVVFGTEWEAEHGVGVLIQGGKVSGFGYAGETDPFDAVAED